MDGEERSLIQPDYGESSEKDPTAQSHHVTASIGFVITQARPGTSAPSVQLYLFSNSGHRHVPCANPDCENGGLDPAPLIRDLLEENPDELRVVACEGRRRQKGGASRGACCDTMFCIRLLEDLRQTVKSRT